MQTSNISLSYYNYDLSYRKVNSYRAQNELQENSSNKDNGHKVSLSAEYKTASFSAVYTKDGNNTDKAAENNEIQKPSDNSSQSLGATKTEIKKQIEMQTYQLLKQYMNKSPELKQSLKDFFVNNPKALEQIGRGEIPEYFNVENTAKRILDIYFSQYNGENKAEFAKRAKSIISQAYGEVEGIAGTLPGIVQQTRDKIYEVLDKFANGKDTSDFINLPEFSTANSVEEKSGTAALSFRKTT